MHRQNMQQMIFVFGEVDLFAVEVGPAADEIDLEGAGPTIGFLVATLKCRRSAASLRAINSGMLNGFTR